ncbi:MAG: hypothetical protein ABII80_01525 [bacterium]
MNKRIDPDLMKAGEQAFWEEFEQLDQPEQRYVVVDTKKNEVVVENVRLIREKKKIRV